MKFEKLNRVRNWIYQAANYDFCPNWNWLLDLLREPVGWVVCAIGFALLIGVMVGPQGYILACAFSALLVLGLAWPWLSMKGVHCQLILPDCRVEENEDLVVTLRVKNFWPLPVFGMMIKGDFLQDCSGAEEPVAFALKRVAAWSESEFKISVTPRRRGQLPTGEVSVASGFPFGLMDVSKPVQQSHSTLVWPSCTSLEGVPVSKSTRLCLHGALSDKAGNDGDSIGVRGYRHGDRLRNIHWAQSARSQSLMVRERQSISSTGSTVVMDLSPHGHGGDGIDSSFEWTIRIAASICGHLHETHSPVRVVCLGLCDFDGENHEDNRNGLRPILDFLATLPTLAKALEAAETTASVDAGAVNGASEQRKNVSKNDPVISSVDRIFVVSTSPAMRSHSRGSLSRGSNVTPVVVDVEGFKTEEELLAFTPSTSPGVSSSPSASGGALIESAAGKSNAILIASPQSATEELVSGWDRSFSDAS